MTATSNIQGGGSSLVAPEIGAIGNAATEIGLFGTAEGSFTYYPVGSGAGQNAFLNNQPTFVGSGVTGTVHFANSDAALTTDQISSYQSNLGVTNSPLIQIPYVVTPITIPVINGPAVTSTTTPQTTPTGAQRRAERQRSVRYFLGKTDELEPGPQSGNRFGLCAERAYQDHLSCRRQRHNRTTDPSTGHCFHDRQYCRWCHLRRWAYVHQFVPKRVPSNFIAAYGDGACEIHFPRSHPPA